MKIWREENDRWEIEEKLEAHTDWVRDVAWSPSVGLPVSRIASCSQVSLNDIHRILQNISPEIMVHHISCII